MSILAFLGLLAAQAAQPRSASLTARRVEIPIREVVLSDGTRRYGVAIMIGTAHVEAGLDTGSTGLRALPHGLKDGDVHTTQVTDFISFGGGTKLEGSVASASITLGLLSGDTTLQLVQKVLCAPDATSCPPESASSPDYRIMGHGELSEGFTAILGVNMAPAVDIAQPLTGLGVRRWIIELPRPGELGPGRLVLNPTDTEVAGYTAVETVDTFAPARGSLHDAVRGCLVNEDTHEKICGAVVLDTGDPGLRVARAGGQKQVWADGTPVTLFFANSAAQVHIAERGTVRSGDQVSRLVFEDRPGAAQPFILAGLLPYLILYDSDRHTIGFKARPVLANGPRPLRIE